MSEEITDPHMLQVAYSLIPNSNLRLPSTSIPTFTRFLAVIILNYISSVYSNLIKYELYIYGDKSSFENPIQSHILAQACINFTNNINLFNPKKLKRPDGLIFLSFLYLCKS